MTKYYNPRVTIGIPVYNVGGYVGRCISSVMKQDYQNIDILITYDISDDDSLDVTLNTLKECPFPYKIIEKNKVDKGLGNSRNIILDNFDGDFLYFVDSDDWIEPSTISLMVNEAVAHDADVVAASHCSFDETDAKMNIFQYAAKRIFDNSSLKNYVYVENGYFSVYSWNKLYKKSFIRDNDIRCIHNVVEDAVFCFLIIEKAQKIVVLPDITLNYLIRNSSITNTIMFDSVSLDTANIYLSIRDYKYSFNKEINKLDSVCSNIDAFIFGYITTVRNSYSSVKIDHQDKLKLVDSAFLTPHVPMKYLFRLFRSKKSNLMLLMLVKALPFSLNMLLVKFYHKMKKV